MAQHWLKSPQARDMALGDVARMSEDDAYMWFYRARWGDGEPGCAHCGVVNAYRLLRNGKRQNRFKCRDPGCGREFTVTSNTILAHHKLTFRKMLEVFASAVHSVKGKAALQVIREACVSYRSAWVLLMKMREALAAAEPEYPLDGLVEVDGAWVGGAIRQENRAVDRVDRRAVENRAPAGRQVITSLRQRPFGALRDRVFSTVTPGEVPRYAEDIVERKAARGAVILSDEHGAYAGLGRLNPAVVQVRHAEALAFGPGINTNGVESHFARVRRSEQASTTASSANTSSYTPPPWRGTRTRGGSGSRSSCARRCKRAWTTRPVESSAAIGRVSIRSSRWAGSSRHACEPWGRRASLSRQAPIA